jgi:exodeoxyribonuclease-5
MDARTGLSAEVALNQRSQRAKQLRDDEERRIAIASHERSLLVEAGAGSGKTALMAGRIALLLARGTPPRNVAAVTFTELAASELLIRVRELVSELSEGRIPAELGVALPNALTSEQRGHLASATQALDEITCSTIHGFCQSLIKPYPVEAQIDPGAAVMDNDQADRVFGEITDSWLREQLADRAGSLLAEMVLHDPYKAVALIHTVLAHLRNHRALSVASAPAPGELLDSFRQSAARFAAFLERAEASEPETAEIVARFSEMTRELESNQPERPADLVRLLLARPHGDLCNEDGTFCAYRKKGKWREAAKCAGLSKIEGERLSNAADEHYGACCESWSALLEATATRVLADLVRLLQPVMDRFRDYKRSAALLDFNDLIFAARALLREHEPVRAALAARFTHVLVDEFQDTDPLQTEIFWRLCGDPAPGADLSDWTQFQIRPGALFLVGDPKQAIYRFRGADVAAYLKARDALLDDTSDAVLSISTNFRSCEPILGYVNDCFCRMLSTENGQPGFTALHPHRSEHSEKPRVVALDIEAAGEDGKASTERQREREAEAIGELCARLIGREPVKDRKSGSERACLPGDIALLAPTGAELWRYEEALERRGIAVSTQAGKGLFWRQEIQDLIALTRTLADRRDTLALGALLRGPLVGLTEEELLDIIWALPKNETDSLPRLDLSVSPESISHPVAREVIERLRALRRQIHATTPYDLLSQAIDSLRVRPMLTHRHHAQAERALANVDLYLNLSRPYAVRGLRAFAEAMTAAWADESRAVEGRPDAQEEAVALYTMHAAKGLEWPIVIPVNTMTPIRAAEGAVTERTGRFHCPVFQVKPKGYEQAREAEKQELNRERIRLWYVAVTRARDLLVLPRMDVSPARNTAWISLLDLFRDKLPALKLSDVPATSLPTATGENPQTRKIFAQEAQRIAERQHLITWSTPSRDEGETEETSGPQILVTDIDSTPVPEAAIQGGRERGIILHKLLEEVLTKETPESEHALITRAQELIRAADPDRKKGLNPTELAGCVTRTLSLPEIVPLRPRLLAEYPVYASTFTEGEEEALTGIADAIAVDESGVPTVVIDWKSDVDPERKTLDHYQTQVKAYLEMTGTERGLIVLVTSGKVIPVTRGSVAKGS